MSEPVDYLTEETYRPAWLVDGLTQSTLDKVVQQKPELMRLGKDISSAKRFYLVGSGGSYSVQLPITYIAEKYTKTPVYAFSGWEFLERRPAAVDKDAVCIFISQSGKTKEIVEALKWCKERGAVTMGLTQETDSVINDLADHPYGWNARGVTLGKLTSLYLLFGAIFQEKGYEIGGKMMEAAEKLPSLLPFMIPKAKETAKKQGLELKDYEHIFMVGGGINWGLTYQYSACILMEMCWVHGIAVDYSEFRHGALELFTEGAAAIFLRSRSEMRELEDKIIEFSEGNGVRCIQYDSQGLDVDNLLTPFTLFIELEWLSCYLSLAKNRRMGAWRFYDKVKF
ncbi:MAG: SIS domain-containing protein [Candidatus Bathyarchaeota archaeon]|nr:SIS domain-containing protein [Candidatus Bathyarchaeota archaeon]